jgi:DNA modification methylase
VIWEIRQGDALERLREMPDESVQCVCTSPPYWGLRDYGVDGQLGLEETPEQFVASMVEVFAEVRRVLRGDGTLWLNIGDSYAGSAGGSSSLDEGHAGKHTGNKSATSAKSSAGGRRAPGIKPKDLVGVPWMLACALRADGWYLRRDIIWSKPNPMPESVTDRPTSSHEYLFLLSKAPRYFYDAEAIREPATFAGPNGAQKSPFAQGFARRSPDQERERQDKQRGHGRRHDGFNDRWDSMSKEEQQALGRNKRSVWAIATRPYPDAHFATFPPGLVEPCILAGSPPRVCGECWAPWTRQLDVDYVKSPKHGAGSVVGRKEASGQNNFDGAGMPRLSKVVTTTGWQPTCNHKDDSGNATVLDPFAGAATTGLVATQLGRDFIGIELNPEYVQLGEDRIRRWEANPAGHLTGDPEPLDGQLSIEEAAA